MANEIRHIGHTAGLSLTADVITSAGVLREGAINLTETPVGKRHYLGDCANIVSGDAVIILNGSAVVGGYLYETVQTATLDTIKAETALIVADTNELQSDNIPALIAALPTDADVNAACDTAISDAAIPAGVRTDLAIELGRIDVAVSTRNATVPATPANVSAVGSAVAALNNITAADVINALKLATGFTQGGTWTLAKLTKVLAAWSSGLWRDKAGVVGAYEVLDPDNGTTVIFEITPLEISPQRRVVVKI